MDPGPLMIDVDGFELTAEDRELLAHPRVGGLVLFTRNYQNLAQLQQLTAQIRAARSGPLLIAVDHEGGRVQRFREGFTAIPPMRLFGELFDTDPDRATDLLSQTCEVIASELSACDIDFSFAPCVDIDHTVSSVIGDRALHGSVDGVVALARAALSGFRHGGMAGVIKHFPGHGSVENDTHHGFALDNRSYEDVAASDMQPFVQLLNDAAAVMPGHVIYQQVDDRPATLSAHWQSEVLRGELGFTGAIVSDDLSMRAATDIASQSDNAVTAVAAGTDLALICNDRAAAIAATDNDQLPVGDSTQVKRRLSLRRAPAKVRLSDADHQLVCARLQDLAAQSGNLRSA
jgi:beta-N-acetylhexosaminidase